MGNGEDLDERNRKILEQLLFSQARLSNTSERHDRALEKMELAVTETLGAVADIARSVNQIIGRGMYLEDVCEKNAESIGTLATAVGRMDEQMFRLEQSIERLERAQEETDGRLNALISVVDDLVRKQPPSA
ncbi:MAG TPA: hypothetical protein VKU01_01365 [Bryobacteraceae bacterium]|nr:hypothetical protein [Bryobacteraceae bacterium]